MNPASDEPIIPRRRIVGPAPSVDAAAHKICAQIPSLNPGAAHNEVPRTPDAATANTVPVSRGAQRTNLSAKVAVESASPTASTERTAIEKTVIDQAVEVSPPSMPQVEATRPVPAEPRREVKQTETQRPASVAPSAVPDKTEARRPEADSAEVVPRPKFDGAQLARHTRLGDHKIPPPPRIAPPTTAKTPPAAKPFRDRQAMPQRSVIVSESTPSTGFGWHKPLIVLAAAVLAMGLLAIALKLGGVGTPPATDSGDWPEPASPPPAWKSNAPTVSGPQQDHEHNTSRYDSHGRTHAGGPAVTWDEVQSASDLYPSTGRNDIPASYAPQGVGNNQDTANDQKSTSDDDVPGVARLQGIIQKTTLEANHDGTRSRLH